MSVPWWQILSVELCLHPFGRETIVEDPLIHDLVVATGQKESGREGTLGHAYPCVLGLYWPDVGQWSNLKRVAWK